MQTLNLHSKLENEKELLALEHKQILQLIADCNELAQNGASQDALIQQLQRIQATLIYHFYIEEDLAIKDDNPHLSIIKSRHDRIRNYLGSTVPQLLASENNPFTVQKIVTDLHEWCVDLQGRDLHSRPAYDTPSS